MSHRRTTNWSPIAILAGVLLALTGLAAPAEAVTSRSIGIAVTPTVQYAGTPVTYSGKVTTSPVGSTVRIQRRSGATWVLARTTHTTTAAGAYSVKLNIPTTAGTYSYRAVAPATASLSAATSRTVGVTALRRTSVTLSASPSVIGTGGSSTLSGSVSPSVPGTAVTVQRLSGGVWVGDTATQVTAGGAFTKSVSPGATTTYRVQVPRAGLNAATTSAARTVTVGPAPTAPVITTTTLPDAAKGVAYSTTLTKTGGSGTWTKSAGSLPAGITLNPGTGVLSGTPTAAGTFAFTVSFTSTATELTGNKSLSLVVTPPPVITTAAALPDATRATPYSVTLTRTGGAGTWSVPSLPSALTLNQNTGEISGLPKVIGEYAVYATFTETATGRTAFKAFSLTIGGTPLAVTTETLPNGTKGMPYTTTLAKTGGDGTWSTPELPGGLSLDPATGIISGTPTVSGTYSVYVAFTETVTGSIAAKGFALTLAPSPVITTTSLPDGTTGSAYSQQLTRTGNAGTWTLTKGTLPVGVTLSAGGLLSGTPTEVGDYGITVTFTETSTSYADSQALLLHVSAPGAPVINTTTLPDGTVGAAYAGQLSATGGPGTWSISYASLPPGLSLNAATGAITGTPAAGTAGDWLFIVKYTTLTSSNTKVLYLHVNPAPAG